MENANDIELKNVKLVLDEYALKFQEMVKKNLIAKDTVASGDLLASIHTTIEILGERYTVYLNSKNYLKFIELGTKPHFPPPQPILEWVRNKKLPTKESTGNKELPTEKQLTFLVCRKIARDGTKAVPVIATTQEQLNEIYLAKLVTALETDIKNWLPIINVQIRFK